MNKEEILAKSRAENKGKDVAAIEQAKAGSQVGIIVMAVLLAIVYIVDWLVFGRAMQEIVFAMAAGVAASRFTQYARQRQRSDLFTAIVTTASAVIYLIAWILQMVKR